MKTESEKGRKGYRCLKCDEKWRKSELTYDLVRDPKRALCPRCWAAVDPIPRKSNTTPEPLSAKGIENYNIECPRCRWRGHQADAIDIRSLPCCPKCATHESLFVRCRVDPGPNQRLCLGIAEILERDDLTPEARALIGLALRVQRGEAVDLGAELTAAAEEAEAGRAYQASRDAEDPMGDDYEDPLGQDDDPASWVG